MGPDTAERSLAHWSEEGRSEMEAFYALAVEDYRQLALAADWTATLGRHAREGWRLLDVACGSGKWPSALQTVAGLDRADLPPLRYDLLDPSAFSVTEARGQLAPPFMPGRELVMRIQDLPADAGRYDVVWATHALYAVPPDELVAGAARRVGARAPGGLGFVAQAASRSHYLVMYDAYRRDFGETTPYTTAEQIAGALTAAGAAVRTQWVRYQSSSSDRGIVEGFLQRCVFDNTIGLDEMERARILGPYLAGCRRPGGSWVFDHEVALLWW
ncbi:MAG: class I SAM-dependent methyltransferase [Acidimicrobiales bacterium]